MTHLAILLLLVACKDGAKSPPPPGQDPIAELPGVASTKPPPRHCPPMSLNNVGYWASELFPACQDQPLETSITFCGGKPCKELPCKTTTTVGTSAWTDHHTFVGGRWTSSLRDSKTTEITCRYEGRLRVACDARGDTYTAKRDDKGRIVEIKSNDHRSVVTYDPEGRLGSVDGDQLLYDPEGRLVRWGEFTFEWDGERMIRDRDSKRTSIHSYDDTGRLVKIHYEEVPPRELTIEYAGDRVAGWKSDNVVVTYGYDCKPSAPTSQTIPE